MPLTAVYVGRPTKWGNPCKVGDWAIGFRERQTAASAVEVYRRHWRILENKEALAELRGKDLACWCPLCEKHKDGKPLNEVCNDCAPCHADVLLEIANK